MNTISILILIAFGIMVLGTWSCLAISGKCSREEEQYELEKVRAKYRKENNI